ncbi:hypothetical protein V6U77_10820 [Micromonospora sp. CPCC 205546]
MSLAAVVAAAVVVRARRRRGTGDAANGALPAPQEAVFADAGTGGVPVTDGMPGQDRRTASPAAATR